MQEGICSIQEVEQHIPCTLPQWCAPSGALHMHRLLHAADTLQGFHRPDGQALHAHLHPVEVLLEAPLPGEGGKHRVQNMEGRMHPQYSARDDKPVQPSAALSCGTFTL